MQRVWFAAIDDMGHEIKVTQDIDVGTVPVIIAIEYPPTMEEYDKVRPPDSAIQPAGETRFIPKEKQVRG